MFDAREIVNRRAPPSTISQFPPRLTVWVDKYITNSFNIIILYLDRNAKHL